MASKKYTLLLGALCLFLSNLSAQSYDWKDSSLVPSSGKAQHSEFLQNQYPFPAKPRNQWEIGISVGNVAISGDVNAKLPQIGWGAHVRKAFGYIFSTRLQYHGGIAKGMNFSPAFNYGKNTAWASQYNAPLNVRSNQFPGGSTGTLYQISSKTGQPFTSALQDPVYYNYRTVTHQLALQGIVTLNNIRFHKAKTNFIIYGVGGVGALIYKTNVNTLDATGGNYANLFRAVLNKYSFEHKNRSSILRDLRAGMDNTYETAAEGQGWRRPKLFDMTLKPTVQAGVGVAFKLGKRFSLGIEEILTWTNDDLLDGQRWQEQSLGGDAPMTRDFDTWHYTSVNLNYSLGAKAVEPLWWLNPLDYAYNELNAPRHMKMPKPVLDDADGDGVTDQFDNEPNTPAGCPVDSHGVSRDTDGDGVPDCKDKELITPTQCQPVDADGVGKCPEPECCKTPRIDNSCHLVDLPSITFAGNSTALSTEAKALVGSVASSLRGNPNCKLVVCGSAAKSKSGQALGQKRVDAIVKYLVEVQGISADRVIAQYDCHEGDPSTVELRAEQK
ncbi:MAG: OmpA family protein [Lacibacter sp.]